MGLWENRISLLLIVFWFFLKLFYVCGYLGGQRGCPIPQNWSYRMLWGIMLLLGVEPRSLEEQLILSTWPLFRPCCRLICRFSGPVQEWNEALPAQGPGYSALKLSHCYISIKYLYMRDVLAAFIANISCRICFSATERCQLDSGVVDSFLSVSLDFPVFSLASEQEAP